MEQQASAVGLRFEADLSNTILDEVQGEPGAMPLLQHLLREMWKRRHGRWLRAAEYRVLGGIQTSHRPYRRRLLQRLAAADQNHVRNILVRLTRLDEDAVEGEDRRDTRRRVSMAELVPAGGNLSVTSDLVNAWRIAACWWPACNRVTNTEEVEVVHEALIRYWNGCANGWRKIGSCCACGRESAAQRGSGRAASRMRDYLDASRKAA